jgi:uncharacterized protein YpmB
MKTYYKEIIFGVFILAIIGNIAIFISSMTLSNEIHVYEQKTFTLTQENTQLEKEMADAESFLHTQEYQTKWGFKRADKPTYVSDLPMALNTLR